jgi:RNase H-fold protein (predicted Holliday junction resolvase)
MTEELDTDSKKESKLSPDELRQLNQRLNESAQHWTRFKKDRKLLWQDNELEQLREYYTHHQDEITAQQFAFFVASERQQWQARVKKKLIKYGVVTTLVILILITTMAGYWFIKTEKQINQVKQEDDQAQTLTQQQLDVALKQERGKVQEAEQQLQQLEQQTKEAEQSAKAQRNLALINQSLWLTEQARQVTAKGELTLGTLLALEALPDSMSAPNKPFLAPALIQLYETVSQLDKSTLAFIGHQASVNYAQWSPNRQWLVTASDDQTARLWDANTGKQLAVFNHNSAVEYAQFSPDGQQIVTSTKDKMGQLWNVNSGQQIALLKLCQFSKPATPSIGLQNIFSNPLFLYFSLYWSCQDSEITHAEFTPNGQIITAYRNKAAQRREVLNASQQDEVLKRHILSKGHQGKVTYATLSPNGQYLVTTSTDHTARRWRIFSTAQALIDYARDIVPQKELTPLQRQQFFLPEE